jgi:hypothetical protein
MDLGPNQEKKNEEWGATGPKIAVRMRKTSLGGLFGETSGDALRVVDQLV